MDLRTRGCTLLIIIILLISACHRANSRPATKISDLKPTLILISLDAFRWDYLDKADTPNLHQLIATGVRSRSLISAFPTKTFPNHYTIATGLWPEHHGIIFNTIYDPQMNAYFHVSDAAAVQDGRWWGGEPIWVTAVKQGQLSATYYWPGSEAAIEGLRPTYWKAFAEQMPYSQRIEQTLAWLDLPVDKRPTFIALYLEEVDNKGHRYGPDSPQEIAAIKLMDRNIGELLQGLQARGIYDQTNIIVTSDHGMTAADANKVIYLDDYLDLSKVVLSGETPVIGLSPKTGDAQQLYQKLAAAHPHLAVYLKSEVPERFHFRDNARIPAIVCLADEGWTITTHSILGAFGYFNRGAHGYDPQLTSMQAIFIAHGPAFANNLIVEPFQNVEIYNLICYALGLKPAPNDGDLNNVRAVLKH
jgi:predicted AlkP superfamily pyrophosphatase or phosphodiesterase